MIKGQIRIDQVVVVSATITDEIERVASEFMKEPLRIHLEAEHMPKLGTSTHSFINTTVRDKTDLTKRAFTSERNSSTCFR